MGISTNGKIKGFVDHEKIFEYIKSKYDVNASNKIHKDITLPISEVTWKHQIKEHSTDNENWYAISGFINFRHNSENRSLFYCYDNLNHFENVEYYTERGLADMVYAETTYISLGCWGSSIEIIEDIISHFGGGWINRNDGDDEGYQMIT